MALFLLQLTEQITVMFAALLAAFELFYWNGYKAAWFPSLAQDVLWFEFRDGVLMITGTTEE